MKTERARLRVLHLGAEGQLLAVCEGFGGSRSMLGEALQLGTAALIVSLRRPTSLGVSSAVAARFATALRPLGIKLHDVLLYDGTDVASLRSMRLL